MNINPQLKKYIKENIFPSYQKNDLGHGIGHIQYVIDRSFKFAKEVKEINYDMVYTIAAYHDIGHYIDAKNHEKISAQLLLEDTNLKRFFTDEEIKIMSEAVYDHRASMEGEPRSIYGKIVSSADRNTLVHIPLQRTYAYRLKHMPDAPLEDIIEGSRKHILDKFGKNGYAKEKMYFYDYDYERFLEEISLIAEDKKLFRQKFFEANGLDNKLKLTFDEVKRHNPEFTLEDILYVVYEEVKDEYNKSFDELKKEILSVNGIKEDEPITRKLS